MSLKNVHLSLRIFCINSLLLVTPGWFQAMSINPLLKLVKPSNYKNYENITNYLNMSLFHFPVLDVLSKMVADGSQGWVHLHTEVTSEAYGCVVYRALLLQRHLSNIVNNALLASTFSFNLI